MPAPSQADKGARFRALQQGTFEFADTGVPYAELNALMAKP
jgi:hypothetical protein